MASDDPYEAAYQAYSRERVLSEVQPSDLDEFKAWKAIKAGVQAVEAEPNARRAPARHASTQIPSNRPWQRRTFGTHTPVGTARRSALLSTGNLCLANA